MASKSPTIVDIHTHIYPPKYVELLKSRTTVPYIRQLPGQTVPHLIILPQETIGRPIGDEFSSIARKVEFMDKHNISISVLSLANPWLDFLPASEAEAAAKEINDDIDAMCKLYPGRLYCLGTLPVSAGAKACVREVKRLRELQQIRGIVMGTTAMGRGLDDEAMEQVWGAIQEEGWTVFLHPHYGLPGGVYGERAGEYGHVLPLALGFPMETTIAIARMFLSGVFDKFPKLQLLLAHSGGTLPFLAGRLESCILHDKQLKEAGKLHQGRRTVWEILKTNVLLDAVIYSSVGLRAAVEAGGVDRLLFGTDHPFFPPVGEKAEEEKWLSVTLNSKAVADLFGEDQEKSQAVLGRNAMRWLKLD
ncbi:Similar to 2-amino-3-carboxymuconate-6-semialdehyde decarboxylase; acc. no. Q8R5M5 [Pyronema omphalodes CBS 100304]|uniref:Similar to 2-amino-3-carboxymuconate-6-semialdehyde decarboxylase acc. no. Q8R5M5 n=1 Tax=Pyronema omphalodes (strain CBS 100304) TaxID=1076935 RepID=U4LK19_PYROM|nr:Similar to 2-amino-3-carboxymuconate-6-semialdehyde decarboxylase; acc. no. Q8R5M5 [Pyronema omphalodes CBS 100304]